MAQRGHRRPSAQLRLDLPRPARKPRRGRPPTRSPGIRHRPRDLDPRCPHHVTLKVLPHVWQLRSRRCGIKVVRAALFAGHDKPGARVVHFSIQHDHVHLVVEAEDRRALARMIQGLAIRIGRGLNRVMRTKGRVFAERYHSRLLKTPTEVRRTVLYVVQNARKHLTQMGHRLSPVWSDDEYSSSPWFAGWTDPRPPPPGPPPVAEARTWLLRRGWIERGGGSIRRDELPRS